MIKSNAEFIANLSSLTSNLRALTEKHKKFNWTKTHQQEFDHIKAVFCKDAINRFFDPNQPTYLFVDAHYTGLGAISAQGPSIQKCLPVAIASRATSKIEKRYPQLDLEGLAVDFGLHRFQQYIIGGPAITIVTDHKPFVSIFHNKHLGSLHLDRIKLHHQNVKYNLIWQKGAINPADYISCHTIPSTNCQNIFKKRPKKMTNFAGFFTILHI